MAGASDLDVAPAPRVVGAGFFLDADTHLRLSAFNSATGVTLTVSGLLMAPDGCVQKFNATHTPATDRTRSTLLIPMGIGWLLSAQIIASAGTPRRGQCFARLELVNGLGGAVSSLGTVLQGYVQDTTVLAYPGSPLEASASGRGVVRSITGTDPAANTEISETVPTNARWRLLAFKATLVADANVANRTIRVVVDDGATQLVVSEAGVNQTAGQTREHMAAAYGLAITSSSGVLYEPLPTDVLLIGGWRLRTVTASIQVGDNWGAPQLLVEEWIED